MFKGIYKAAAATLLVFSVCAVHAVPLPDSGLWGFDAEANGQPGRGFQIDQQQGSLMLFTYMGYRADGSPLFLQQGASKLTAHSKAIWSSSVAAPCWAAHTAARRRPARSAA